MKQSKNSRHVIETALIALICIFVLWLSANMVISQTKDTMRDELSHVEKRLEKVYELYDTSNSNQKRVQKHLARLGAYYLKMTDDPLSKKTVDRLRDILDITENACRIIPAGVLVTLRTYSAIRYTSQLCMEEE